MDLNDIEKECGIMIFVKNCVVEYEGMYVNIVDILGYVDFGGEVECVLLMVDLVLLFVDVVEGLMLQMCFVMKKVFVFGLKLIVVVNKIDCLGVWIDWVINQIFDLFDKFGVIEEQFDFLIVYVLGLNGYVLFDLVVCEGDMCLLFEVIFEYVLVCLVDLEVLLQFQIMLFDYLMYVGWIGVGCIMCGCIKLGQLVVMCFGLEGDVLNCKINQVLFFKGLECVQVELVEVGDIVLINGIEDVGIGVMICVVDMLEVLLMIIVDELMLMMNFFVNLLLFVGCEGKFVMSCQICDCLMKELNYNVVLCVKDIGDEMVFEVLGCGELYLMIFVENMCCEGYELVVLCLCVVMQEIDGVCYELYELLMVDVEDEYQGGVMEEFGCCKGEMFDMVLDGCGCMCLEYKILVCGLIGFQSEFLMFMCGMGLMSYIFDLYVLVKDGLVFECCNGVLILQDDGVVVVYVLWKLQDCGCMFVKLGDVLYEGMIIGIYSCDNDFVVNLIKGKQLINVCVLGIDEVVCFVLLVQMLLEYVVEFIDDDEFVEVMLQLICLCKCFLKEYECCCVSCEGVVD